MRNYNSINCFHLIPSLNIVDSYHVVGSANYRYLYAPLTG